jgi:hypothetical protein
MTRVIPRVIDHGPPEIVQINYGIREHGRAGIGLTKATIGSKSDSIRGHVQGITDLITGNRKDDGHARESAAVQGTKRNVSMVSLLNRRRLTIPARHTADQRKS